MKAARDVHAGAPASKEARFPTATVDQSERTRTRRVFLASVDGWARRFDRMRLAIQDPLQDGEKVERFSWRDLCPKRRSRASLLLFVAIGSCKSDPEPTPLLDAAVLEDAGILSFDSGAGDVFDRDCDACRIDGETCEVSINCQRGSICNQSFEDFFDPMKALMTCIKVLCSTASDCDPEEVCTPERLCAFPICQNDRSCEAGLVCRNGACSPRPAPSVVASCTTLTRRATTRSGSTITLVARAIDGSGAETPGTAFRWTSNRSDVASISADVAMGGTLAGTATVTAAVLGNEGVRCRGNTVITNFAALAVNTTRVVVVAEDTGAPVQGAQVTLVAGPTSTTTTGSDGAALFMTSASIDAVVVEKSGHDVVAVLSPGSNDLYLVLPRAEDRTRAGGFRGSADISHLRRADIRLGLAGAALLAERSDFGLRALFCDAIETSVDAPELGFDQTLAPIPRSAVFAFGNKAFTADALRCQGELPSDTTVGCFVPPASEGGTAAWSAAGYLRLSELLTVVGEPPRLCESIALPMGLPQLLDRLDHAIVPHLEIVSAPKVSRAGAAADCADPTLPAYDAACRPDFAEFVPLALRAAVSTDIHSRVAVPMLPALFGGGCLPANLVVAGTVLPHRGFVPLGFGSGLDVREGEGADCLVAGDPTPFGASSAPLPDGIVALSMAPPHSGVEGHPIMILSLAHAVPMFGTSPLHLGGRIHRVPEVTPDLSIPGIYPGFVEASLNTSTGTFLMSAPPGAATFVKVELRRGSDAGVVYFPVALPSITIPPVRALRALMGTDMSAFVNIVELESVSYRSVFLLGSGAGTDRLWSSMAGFALTECRTTQEATCRIN